MMGSTRLLYVLSSKLRISGTLLVTAALLLGTTSQAEEGFYSLDKNTPSVVRQLGNSTYMSVWTEGDRIAISPAVLVWKEKTSQGKMELVFLAARHEVGMVACARLGVCRGLSLIQDGGVKFDSKDQKIFKIYNKSTRFKKVQVVKLSFNPDLALLRVVVPDTSSTPPLVAPAQDCNLKPSQRLYTVGFPAGYQRADRSVSKPFHAFKRWSTGIYLGPRHGTIDAGEENWDGSTVDVIPGNSGGALINEGGELMGIVRAMNFENNNGLNYVGSEQMDRAQAFSVKCQQIKDFLYN